VIAYYGQLLENPGVNVPSLFSAISAKQFLENQRYDFLKI
jgi:hypothetical protein